MTKPAQTAARRLLQQLPQLPLKDAAKSTFQPSGSLRKQKYREPDLYAVFPFRILGAGKPDVEIAVNTFEARKVQDIRKLEPGRNLGGLPRTGRPRASIRHPDFTAKSEQRCPAFQGFDPDQTNENVASMALQTMLVQSEGEKLLVGPAWPKKLGCRVQGCARPQHSQGLSGKLENLKVTPDKRNADIVRLDPQ